MAETTINSQHTAYLAKMQHIGEWLAQEQVRAEAELRHVIGQATRHAQEVTAFLQRTYGLDAAHVPVSIDTERGVLITPDASPNAPDEPSTAPLPTLLPAVPQPAIEPATEPASEQE